MKRIMISVVLILFYSFSFAETENCQKFYEDDAISLCVKRMPDLDPIYPPGPAYGIYATNKITSQTFLIGNEIDIENVKIIAKIPNVGYFYRAYLGGNSPNASDRHILIVFNGNQIINAGQFSGWEDIDSDGVKDFFTWEISKFGRDSASHEYTKTKMVLQNNKLIVQR